LIAAEEKARLQHALLILVQELNRVMVLVILYPPDSFFVVNQGFYVALQLPVG